MEEPQARLSFQKAHFFVLSKLRPATCRGCQLTACLPPESSQKSVRIVWELPGASGIRKRNRALRKRFKMIFLSAESLESVLLAEPHVPVMFCGGLAICEELVLMPAPEWRAAEVVGFCDTILSKHSLKEALPHALHGIPQPQQIQWHCYSLLVRLVRKLLIVSGFL